ncbi:PspA/IM30 family protein [Sphingobacterium sp. DN00404]|uniref:PspA/IM30 family protein n=1 Tax=Sphingobacterium micropteri TaxID=2763501 RepID=A0ABR7YP94_9SPHI|nr:PspA/IM30 family protein [Sphingobacterium micropteri]MBD1433140.1 PspA/IM30 family protein [Sphingobacterium micropteri]
MMNIFKRLLKIGQSEIHALVDRMEDPIHMIEQGIRDLKEELAEVIEKLAQAKASKIRLENKAEQNRERAEQMEEKAKTILLKYHAGKLETDVANRLAKEALLNKQDLVAELDTLQDQIESRGQAVEKIAQQLEILRYNISRWEKELTILKAKQKVTQASELANRHIATMDAHGTIDMLKRMKTKAEDDEDLAQAYAEIAQQNMINEVEDIKSKEKSAEEELENLKRELKKQ